MLPTILAILLLWTLLGVLCALFIGQIARD
jgi:hypothetical protein